jgi:NAD(P)-dependent dehydrogenase (short-subunit alcohol dehydrogenase family)
VYICDFNPEHLETHRRELQSLYPGVDIHAREFDAADEQSVKGVVEDAVKRYGRLDIFFANAGVVGQHKLFSAIDADEMLATLRTNVVR